MALISLWKNDVYMERCVLCRVLVMPQTGLTEHNYLVKMKKVITMLLTIAGVFALSNCENMRTPPDPTMDESQMERPAGTPPTM